MATVGGKPEILHNIWDRAEENLTREELKSKFLLATHNMGRTVLHATAKWGNVEILQKLQEWARVKLTTEEVNKLFLSTDREIITAWHVAAKDGQLKLLDEIWDLEEEIISKLLLATDNNGRTVLYLAAEGYETWILQKNIRMG